MENMTDGRLKKELGVSRRSRAQEDREVTERRDISEDERLEMFRMQMHNDVLPDLPEIPGYHVCWLTTTNPRDPIQRRIRLGYEPIMASEIPGMEFASVKTGEWSGLIGVNEMLAFKLPLSLYERFMQEAHHDAPLREESKLAEVADMLRDEAQHQGAGLYEGDGMSDLRHDHPARGIFE